MRGKVVDLCPRMMIPNYCSNDIITTMTRMSEVIVMNHLEELLNKFPEIPRSAVIKTDLIMQGMRYTPILKEIGKWSLPQTHGCYEFDHEDLHTKDDATEGWIEIPFECRLSNDTTYSIMIMDSNSPYEIRREDGKYMLCLEGNPIEEVTFSPRPKWYSRRTSNGTLMSKVASQFGDAFTVMCINYCEYFKTDDACLFCCLNPTTDRSKELGIDRAIGRNIDDVIETCAEASKECRHMVLSGGGIIDRKKEAGMYIKMLTALREAGYQPEDLTICSQALDEDDARKLYDLGVRGPVVYAMEVWQENLWPIIVPGKSKFVGRDRWINSLIKGVEIFGRGNVQTNFVGGCEMVPPHGFKDIDKAVESTLGGFEWLAQRGIIPTYTCWTKNAGSKGFELNVEIPPVEYYLKLASGHHKLLSKYDLSLTKSRCYKCSILTLLYDLDGSSRSL